MASRVAGPSWRVAGTAARVLGLAALIIGVRVLGVRLPGPASSSGVSPNTLLFVGSVLVLLAGGLQRRMGIAGILAAALVLVAMLGESSVPRLRMFGAAVASVMAIIAVRDALVWPSRRRMALAARFTGVAVVVLVSVGVATALLSREGPRDRSIASVTGRGVALMLGRDHQQREPSRIDHRVDQTLSIASGVIALALLALLLHAESDALEDDGLVRTRVTSLCESGDGDTLAPFTGRQDKNFVFSPDGRAVIGYRTVFGVCVAGPGPVGAPPAHGDALEQWVRRCDDNGWRPAMIGASDATRSLAATLGLHGICIGDEAVLDVSAFRLDQPAMRRVRQAVQRTHNAGVSVTVHREGDLDAVLRSELDAVVEQWRGPDREVGFSMSMDHLLDGTYPGAVVFVAHHRERPVAFQRYFQARGGAGLSLDVMPRRRDAPNGVNERLIAEATSWGADRGVKDISLNFGAFRALFEAEPSPARRFMCWGVHLLDPFINVESLYRFNAKFHPSWIRRHVLFRSPTDLPAVLCAALHVEFSPHSAATGETALTPESAGHRPIGTAPT